RNRARSDEVYRRHHRLWQEQWFERGILGKAHGPFRRRIRRRVTPTLRAMPGGDQRQTEMAARSRSRPPPCSSAIATSCLFSWRPFSPGPSWRVPFWPLFWREPFLRPFWRGLSSQLYLPEPSSRVLSWREPSSPGPFWRELSWPPSWQVPSSPALSPAPALPLL